MIHPNGTGGGAIFSADKKTFRQKGAQGVLGLSVDLRRRHDAMISDFILATSQYRQARQVLAYSALADEVSLDVVIERARGEGKAVFLPALDESGAGMGFMSWPPGEERVRGRFGLLEPRQGEAPLDVASLTLVPGRAFDGHGHRVGRGRGYYDRVLDGLASLGPVLGVAYSCQVFAEVPASDDDRSVDFVITEKGQCGG